SSVAGAKSSTRSASAWLKRASARRRFSSRRSTSRRRATRTTSCQASTSSTSSATGGRISTASLSRRWKRSRPEEVAMAAVEETLTYEALLDRDGVKVSKSPWGPEDEIGRLNWITSETNRTILEHLD